MKKDRLQEICQEIARARKSLSAARKLDEEKLFEDAISLSYYAVLHAAKAVLLLEDVEVGSHQAVKRLFGMHTNNILNHYIAASSPTEAEYLLLLSYESGSASFFRVMT